MVMAKRHADQDKVTNYLQRHDLIRRWGSVMLLVALLVTTVTLYALNKSASAVTEEGADEVGMVLDMEPDSQNSSEGSEDESGENSEDGQSGDSSNESSSEESGEGDANEPGSDVDDSEGTSEGSDESDENSSESSEEAGDSSDESEPSSEETSSESESSSSDEESSDNSESDDSSTDEEDTQDDNSEDNSDSDSEASTDDEDENTSDDSDSDSEELTDETEDDELDGEGKTKKSKTDAEDEEEAEEEAEEEEEDELTQDVVLTVSYVDEEGYLVTDDNGVAVADKKEINISESLNIAEEAPEIFGYTFEKATYKGKVIDGITVNYYEASDENQYKYYTLERDGAESIEVKEDSEVIFVYSASEEKKTVIKKKKVVIDDVKITAAYQDTNGNVIGDSNELSTTGILDLTDKENITAVEGYFFDKVAYDGMKIVSIKAVEKEITKEDIDKAIEDGKAEEIEEVVTESSDDTGSDSGNKENSDSESTENAENNTDETGNSETSESGSENSDQNGQSASEAEGNVVILTEDEEGNLTLDESSDSTYSAYELVAADGTTVELTKDTELVFTYLPANTVEDFTVNAGKATVSAKLTNPGSLPEGIQLIVTELTSETEGYNYDAYLKAMNDNADKIAQASEQEQKQEEKQEEAQAYDETNTLFYDIAFKLDGIEYQPAEGSVSISIKLNDKKVSEELGATSEEEIAIVHMPVSEEVMQNVDATSEATDISANDINVEILQDTSVELGDKTDTVEFSLDNFSVIGIAIFRGDFKTWEGNVPFSAYDIVEGLGDATYFSAVANNFYANGNHSEGNVAAKNISDVQTHVIGNSTNVYKFISDYSITVNKTVKPDGQSHTFYFALYTDENGKNKIAGKDFSITTDASTGKGSAILTDKFDKYMHVYVFELDGQNGNPVMDGETFGSYTVSYKSDTIEGGNEIVGTFNTSYVENIGDYSADYICGSEPGTSLYYKESNSVYYEFVRGGENNPIKHTGAFPISISNMLSDAADLSSQLAYAQETDTVHVVNIVATDNGYLHRDLSNVEFGDTQGTYAQNTGFKDFPRNKILLINVDMTVASSYTLNQFLINGVTTGNWTAVVQDQISAADQIVINVVKKDGNDRFVPYDGTITADIMSGTLIAPKANVVLTGSFCGTAIGNVVDKKCEIHKVTVRRFLTAQGTTEVYNDTAELEAIKLSVDKYINDALATDAETGKFKFTLEMLDTAGRTWKHVSDVTNTAGAVNFTINPGKEGMSYGSGVSNEDQKAHTYYFKITESSTGNINYTNDTSGILVKIKYYPEEMGGETCYYRVSAAELEYLANNPGTGFYNNDHRIENSKKTDLLTKVAFFNKTAETVDIEVTKAWVLNGQSTDKIPAIEAARWGEGIVLQLYADGREIPPYENTPTVTVVENPSSVNDKADVVWLYKWTKLPKYDSQGSPIKYTVSETVVPSGFSTDTPAKSPIEIKYSDEQYTNAQSGSTTLGKGAITNTGTSLKLTLYKYEDNALASHSYEFWMRMTSDLSSVWSDSSSGAVLYNGTSGNDKGVINYTIDTADWGMETGHTYYLRFNEPYGDKDKKYGFPSRDRGVIIAKISYNGANDITINYYRIDETIKDERVDETKYGRSVAKFLITTDAGSADMAKEYCLPQFEVTDKKVAFYNSSKGNIEISVTKEWDELVGQAKNEKAVADSIWDVTFKLYRSLDGNDWEQVEEYTIKAPRIYQSYEGADFQGDLNDYPEDWTYKSNTITIKNLSAQYKYRIEEYYGDEQLNAASYVHSDGTVDSGSANTVNGFKLEKVTETVDKEGNIDYVLHNTPYVQLYKYWKSDGKIVSTEEAKNLGFGSVYVKLYRNYRADKSYVQVTKDELSKGYAQYVHQTANNGAIIELSAGNDWYAEFALDRKYDNWPGATHVYQYVYLMVECDNEGNEIAENSSVTYGSINTSNVTRTGADYNYERGFKDKVKGDKTLWEDAWVSGNNYPVCKLTVTNNRDTYSLPKSGGIGSTPFTIAGILLIAIALALLIFRSKSSIILCTKQRVEKR